ncbi:Hypothetical predicted protein [Mytilus galloprovincialis]|uniref:CCHC-type domain-containing protein n=1 Tax=Mytilus galloprovincialis TaxID=29158 RepID=A0A8B6DPK5_MYTGA|nr:Hypothetical predicted protein [Mytilus galloprovincialis]
MAKMMEDFSKLIDSFQKNLDNLKSDMTKKGSDTLTPGWKDNIQCYNCGRFGHFRNECRVIRGSTMEIMIHSDQGRLFEIELSSEIFNLLQISKTRTTPYHRQSDTPNRLMMEREVTTPVNILNKLAMEVKVILASKWVWELQERMEDAHQFVQNHVNRKMLLQKQFQDNHLSCRQQKIQVDRKKQRLLGKPLQGERLKGFKQSNQVSEMNDHARDVGESASIEPDFEKEIRDH